MTNKENILSVQAPSSKSMSHRLLMGAALANGESTVYNVLESQDLKQTMEILSQAGAKFEKLENNDYKVIGSKMRGKDDFNEPLFCDVHESGTTCRLMTAILASGLGYFYVHGSERMNERPIGTLTTCLEELGTKFQFENKNYPPFILFANGLKGGEITISLEESSQYLSGLLLAAPLAKDNITIYIGGKHVVSFPYIGLTLQAMKVMGASFDVCILDKEKSSPDNKVWKLVEWKKLTEIVPGETRFRVRPFKADSDINKIGYKSGDYHVEGDWSSASYLLAAGALGQRPVRVENLNKLSLHPDRYFLEILKQMKAKVEFGNAKENSITVYPSHLMGIEVNMTNCPDLVPTVAVLASFAHGETKIYGVEHLRIKESDRLLAMCQELQKAGVDIKEMDDGLIIQGLHPQKPLSQAMKISLEQKKENLENSDLDLNEQIEQSEHLDYELEDVKSNVDTFELKDREFTFSSHNDHRIVMALSLLNLLGAKINFDRPEVVAKSFPNFWKIWEDIC